MSDEHTHAIPRRHFLAAALALSGLTAAAVDRVSQNQVRIDERLAQFAAEGGAAAATDRPNILVITTDQQWAGAMSCAGNPYLHTPHMDSLAREGVQFECAYAANPICVPSRTSYMTGTASHTNGVTTNVREGQVPVDVPCLGTTFRDAGYDTGYVGKWHLPRGIEDREWSGFNYTAGIKNRVDGDIPEHCAEFLLRKRDAPFLLFASFVNPHDICEWARIYSGMDDELPNGDVGTPPPPAECPPFRPNYAVPDGEPSVIRQHQADPGMDHAYPTRFWDVRDDRWRQYLWGYYRMNELVDAYIGQILHLIREMGIEENTVIVFASDHGDGIGSHRWNQKTIFYEEVSRVPFIVSWKGQTQPGGRNSRHLVNLGLDLFPTMLDAAGIEKPAGLYGVSALPYAKDPWKEPTREYIVCENNHHGGSGNPTTIHGRMVRSERYKYIRYNEGDPNEQLFDLALDPGETRDLTATGEVSDVLDAHRAMLRDYNAMTSDTTFAV